MDPPTEASDPTVNQNSGTVDRASNQKRPRDYGEELKGLPTSDDEDGREASLPTLKKQKTDGANPAEAEDSGLDDGEIVESSPAPAGPGRDTEESPHNVMHDFSEDGEVGSSAAEAEPEESNVPTESFFIDRDGSKPVPRSGWNEGVSLGTRTSFGNADSRLFPAISSTAAPSRRDDEDGEEGEDEDESKDDDDAEDESKTQEDIIPNELSKGKKTKTFTAADAIWKYPTGPEISVKFEDDASSPSFWNEKLRVWTKALLQANERSVAERLNGEVIRKGFMLQYHGKPNLFERRAHKKMDFVGVAKKVIVTVNLQALIRDARASLAKDAIATYKNTVISIDSESEEDMEEVAPSPAADGDDEELQQQRKYFPGVEDPSQFCLSCSGIGHKSQDCPHLRCKFCESQDHSSFGCPTKQRCSKCHQLGHAARDCEEKLALAAQEQDGCAFCGAKHTEEQCTEIWRSFALTEETRKKVKDIPAFCYTCGAQGHYGPECGLPDVGGKVTGKTTWSQLNRLRYVDPDSPDVAIAWINVDPPSTEFHIRGRAKRPTHTHFVSSDESEGEDLVHAPLQKPAPRGEIRIASNIGSVPIGQNSQNSTRNGAKNKNRKAKSEKEAPPPPQPQPQRGQNQPQRGQDNRGSSWQPPLPPGPPPSITGNAYSFRGSLPSAALASLPPKPQARSQVANNGSNAHNSSYQSRGGGRGAFKGGSNRGGQHNRGSRGGGRGNGRGRGRGRGN
ncbi:hypothetical protein GGR53DRAFT_512974 [Hypoxylon sp. FL1150]|nr:hypothetical protein GGR53DRAFT_512974 [Hypoxylon sp. FL1150]